MTCCEKTHEPDERFFTGILNDNGQHRALSGPFETHDEALADVDRVRALATEYDPRGHWYAYGTCGTTDQDTIEGLAKSIATLPPQFRVNATCALL